MQERRPRGAGYTRNKLFPTRRAAEKAGGTRLVSSSKRAGSVNLIEGKSGVDQNARGDHRGATRWDLGWDAVSWKQTVSDPLSEKVGL